MSVKCYGSNVEMNKANLFAPVPNSNSAHTCDPNIKENMGRGVLGIQIWLKEHWSEIVCGCSRTKKPAWQV